MNPGCDQKCDEYLFYKSRRKNAAKTHSQCALMSIRSLNTLRSLISMRFINSMVEYFNLS